MKLGCCASLWEDRILKLPAAGADYAEAGFSSLMGKSLDQVRARAAQLEKAGVSLESMNVLFPGDFRLTGPQADFSAVDSYLEENLPKAQALGVKVVVFGSGGARRVPEGFPQEEAFAQLVELCREHIAPAAARTTSPSSRPWRPWATRGASPWRATPGAACPRFAPRWRTCASSSARRPSKHREAAG